MGHDDLRNGKMRDSNYKKVKKNEKVFKYKNFSWKEKKKLKGISTIIMSNIPSHVGLCSLSLANKTLNYHFLPSFF